MDKLTRQQHERSLAHSMDSPMPANDDAVIFPKPTNQMERNVKRLHYKMITWTSLLLLLLALCLATLGAAPSDAAMSLPDGIENILGFVPQSNFQCERDGYFGDAENDCRLFHLCQKTVNSNGKVEWQHWTYACGNQTMFNQLTLTCAFMDEAIPCKHASQFQYLNEVIHRPREPFLTDADVTSGFSYYSNRIMSDGARARAFEDSTLLAQLAMPSLSSNSLAPIGSQSQPIEELTNLLPQPEVTRQENQHPNQFAPAHQEQHFHMQQQQQHHQQDNSQLNSLLADTVNQLQEVFQATQSMNHQSQHKQQHQQSTQQVAPEASTPKQTRRGRSESRHSQDALAPVASSNLPEATFSASHQPIKPQSTNLARNIEHTQDAIVSSQAQPEGFNFAITTNHHFGLPSQFNSLVSSHNFLNQEQPTFSSHWNQPLSQLVPATQRHQNQHQQQHQQHQASQHYQQPAATFTAYNAPLASHPRDQAFSPDAAPPPPPMPTTTSSTTLPTTTVREQPELASFERDQFSAQPEVGQSAQRSPTRPSTTTPQTPTTTNGNSLKPFDLTTRRQLPVATTTLSSGAQSSTVTAPTTTTISTASSTPPSATTRNNPLTTTTMTSTTNNQGPSTTTTATIRNDNSGSSTPVASRAAGSQSSVILSTELPSTRRDELRLQQQQLARNRTGTSLKRDRFATGRVQSGSILQQSSTGSEAAAAAAAAATATRNQNRRRQASAAQSGGHSGFASFESTRLSKRANLESAIVMRHTEPTTQAAPVAATSASPLGGSGAGGSNITNTNATTPLTTTTGAIPRRSQSSISAMTARRRV